MVRRGKLSKGCQTCRQRKIKCDLATPSCSQCSNAGWTCPQYGDVMERKFQNQDITHFQNLPNKRCPQKYNEPTQISSNPSPRRHFNFSKEIVPSINDRAIDFYLLTHACKDSGALRGYFEYLPVFYNNPGTDRTLFTALSAVALAAFASVFQHVEVLNETKRKYGLALHILNRSLSSRQEAAKDSTLVSIILLSTFGALTCNDLESLSDCSMHTNGMMTIIKLRGHRQMESRRGLQMFLHVAFLVIQDCLFKSSSVPTELIELRTYAEKFLDTDDPAWKLANINVKLANFRAIIKDHILEDSSKIVEVGIRIDSELCLLRDDMPPEWQFKTFHMKEKSDFVLESHYHAYSGVWEAHIWNSLRNSRLLLHESIQKYLITNAVVFSPQLFTPTDLIDYQSSAKAVQHLISDICATVPQFSGQLSMLWNYTIEAEQRTSQRKFDGLPETVPISAGTYLLLWPLVNAGRLAKLQSQQDWIIQSSYSIGQRTGIQQAFLVASALKSSHSILKKFQGSLENASFALHDSNNTYLEL